MVWCKLIIGRCYSISDDLFDIGFTLFPSPLSPGSLRRKCKLFVRINGLGQRSRQNQLPSHPCPAGPALLYNAQFMFNLPRKVVAVFSNNTFIKEYQFYSDAEPTCTSDANNQISSIYPTVMNNSSSFFSIKIKINSCHHSQH